MPRSSFDFERGVTQWRMEPLTGAPRAGQWAFTLGYDGEVPRYEDLAYGDYFQTSQEIDTTGVGLIRCHVNIKQPRSLPSYEDISQDVQFIEESVDSPGNRVVISRGVSEADINKTLIVAGTINPENSGAIKLTGICDSLTMYADRVLVTEGPNASISAILTGARWKFSLLIDGVEYARCIQSDRESGFYRDDLILHCSKLTGLHTISFRITLVEHDPANVYSFFVQPPLLGLIQWVKGDAGMSVAATRLSAWADQSGMNQHFNAYNDVSNFPYVLGGTLDGIPLVTFGNAGIANKFLFTSANFKDRNSADMDGNSARTIMAVTKPTFDPAYGRTGGILWSTNTWGAGFELRGDFVSNGAYAWIRAGGDYGSALQFTPVTGGAAGPYDGTPTLITYASSGFPNLIFSINGVTTTLTPSAMYGAPGAGTAARLSGESIAFLGGIAELLVWDYDLTTSPAAYAAAITYIKSRYPSITLP